MTTIEPASGRRRPDGATLIALASLPMTNAASVLAEIKAMDQGEKTKSGTQAAPIISDVRRARAWAARLPSFEVLARLSNDLRAALCEPPNEIAARLMIGVRLDGSGRKPPEHVQTYVDEMMQVVADVSDPAARAHDLWPTIPGPAAPVVVALAIKIVRNTRAFTLETSEFSAAIVEAYSKQTAMARVLHDYAQAREQADTMIRADGNPVDGVPATRPAIILADALPVERAKVASALDDYDPAL
jgi:hypothetical protein